MALLALALIPGSSADAALQQVAATGSNRMRIGAVNALGNRKAEIAIADLARYVAQPDTALADASVAALGRIGSGAALDALQRTAKTASASSHPTLQNALLKCADNLRKQGNGEQALAIYGELQKSSEPASIRRAALRGVVLSDPDNAASVLTNTLQSKEPSLQPVAGQLVREIRDIEKVRTIASHLPGLPEANQAQLLSALSPFRDAEVQKRVVAASKSKSVPVRLAAIKTLGAMGDARVASLLVGVAASSRGAEQKEARNSLSLLHAAGVDDSLVAMIPRADGSSKVECIKAVGVRAAGSAVPNLLQAARSPLSQCALNQLRLLKQLRTVLMYLSWSIC